VVVEVSDQPITPIIPPRMRRHPGADAGRRTARPLPLPSCDGCPPLPHNVVYGMGRLDRSGRIAEHTISTTLAWQPGDRLTVTTGQHSAELHRDPHGLLAVTSRAYLPLPAAARQRLGIEPGQRVLLAATAATDHLTIYPLATLHHALTTILHRSEPA
jgi:hypothetical protein